MFLLLAHWDAVDRLVVELTYDIGSLGQVVCNPLIKAVSTSGLVEGRESILLIPQ
jgi:hypothetical protein